MIEKVAKFAGKSVRGLAKELDLAPHILGNIQSGRVAKFSPLLRMKILARYPDISPQWLETGEGDMLRSGEGVAPSPAGIMQTANNSSHVQQSATTSATPPPSALAEIAAQRRLTEKAQEQLTAAQGLAEKAQGLAEKAQAHIDRLLTIIDRLTDE